MIGLPSRRTSAGMLSRLAVTTLLLALSGWSGHASAPPAPTTPAPAPEIVRLRVTGYCNCRVCRVWRRTWFGRPVRRTGHEKGKRIQIGITRNATRARHGTIAALPSLFPYGTRLDVPGYGQGIVDDQPIGPGLAARHADPAIPEIRVWFRNHSRAIKWGSQILDVQVRRPEWAAPIPPAPAQP